MAFAGGKKKKIFLDEKEEDDLNKKLKGCVRDDHFEDLLEQIVSGKSDLVAQEKRNRTPSPTLSELARKSKGLSKASISSSISSASSSSSSKGPGKMKLGSGKGIGLQRANSSSSKDSCPKEPSSRPTSANGEATFSSGADVDAPITVFTTNSTRSDSNNNNNKVAEQQSLNIIRNGSQSAFGHNTWANLGPSRSVNPDEMLIVDNSSRASLQTYIENGICDGVNSVNKQDERPKTGEGFAIDSRASKMRRNKKLNKKETIYTVEDCADYIGNKPLDELYKMFCDPEDNSQSHSKGDVNKKKKGAKSHSKSETTSPSGEKKEKISPSAPLRAKSVEDTEFREDEDQDEDDLHHPGSSSTIDQVFSPQEEYLQQMNQVSMYRPDFPVQLHGSTENLKGYHSDNDQGFQTIQKKKNKKISQRHLQNNKSVSYGPSAIGSPALSAPIKLPVSSNMSTSRGYESERESVYITAEGRAVNRTKKVPTRTSEPHQSPPSDDEDGANFPALCKNVPARPIPELNSVSYAQKMKSIQTLPSPQQPSPQAPVASLKPVTVSTPSPSSHPIADPTPGPIASPALQNAVPVVPLPKEKEVPEPVSLAPPYGPLQPVTSPMAKVDLNHDPAPTTADEDQAPQIACVSNEEGPVQIYNKGKYVNYSQVFEPPSEELKITFGSLTPNLSRSTKEISSLEEEEDENLDNVSHSYVAVTYNHLKSVIKVHSCNGHVFDPPKRLVLLPDASSMDEPLVFTQNHLDLVNFFSERN